MPSVKLVTAVTTLQTSFSQHYSNEIILLISRGKDRDRGTADGIHYSSTYFKALNQLAPSRYWLCMSILSLISLAEYGSQRKTSTFAAVPYPHCEGEGCNQCGN